MNQQVPTAPASPAGGGSKSAMWLLVILLIVILAAGAYYYFAIFSKKTTGTSTTTPTAIASTSAQSQWLTYSIVPAAEEASEAGSAVKFSISYPSTWTYKVLDEEIKASGGADNNLHYVAFGKQTPITAETASVSVIADSHKYSEATDAVLYATDAVKTQTTVGTYNATKFVGKKAGMSGVDTKDSVAYAIETPNSWILIVEGPLTESTTIDQMVQTVKF